MALKDPSQLPPLQTYTETKTFTDPEALGEEWEFTFSIQKGYAAALFIDSTAQQHIEYYIQQKNTIDYSGYEIPVSKALCYTIANILLMDKTPTDGGLKWQFQHWAIFSQRCPVAFAQVLKWCGELVQKSTGKTIKEFADSPIDTKNG